MTMTNDRDETVAFLVLMAPDTEAYVEGETTDEIARELAGELKPQDLRQLSFLLSLAENYGNDETGDSFIWKGMCITRIKPRYLDALDCECIEYFEQPMENGATFYGPHNADDFGPEYCEAERYLAREYLQETMREEC